MNKYVNPIKITIAKPTLLILITTLLLFPLIWCPSCTNRFEIPKVNFLQISTQILACTLLFLPHKLKPKPLSRTILITLTLWTSTLIISLFATNNLQQSLIGNYYRQDGLITHIHLTILSLAIARYWQPHWLKPILWSISLGTGLTALLNLTPLTSNLISFGFGNPVIFTGYLLTTIPIQIHLIQQSQTTLKAILPTITLSLTILNLLLINATITYLIIPIYLLGRIFYQTSNRIRITILLILLPISIYLGNWYLHQPWHTPESRIRIIHSLWNASLEKPLTGWGIAQVDQAFTSHPWPQAYPNDIYLDKAHSHLLEHLVTTGFPGLIAYLTLTLFISLSLIKKESLTNRTLFLTWLTYTTISQTNITSIATDLIWWLLLAITLAQKTAQPKKLYG